MSKTSTFFLNARLVDPETGRDEPGGLLIKDGVIADLGGHLRRNAPEGAEVVDCKGHVLCPGIIDAQVFTGEPGGEHRETLKTASHAAAVRQRVEAMERALERAFHLPVLNRPVGLDALVGLVPVAGDLISAGLGLYLVAAWGLRVGEVTDVLRLARSRAVRR